MHKTRDSITDVWGERTPYVGEWPERVDQYTLEEPEKWVQSACVLCSNGCGMDIGVKNGKIVGVRGRAVDIANAGRLGPKGLHGWIANSSPDRLTHPLIRRHGKLEQASWDEALDRVAAGFDAARKKGPQAFGIFSCSKASNEMNFLAQKFARQVMGTNNIDSCNRT